MSVLRKCLIVIRNIGQLFGGAGLTGKTLRFFLSANKDFKVFVLFNFLPFLILCVLVIADGVSNMTIHLGQYKFKAVLSLLRA